VSANAVLQDKEIASLQSALRNPPSPIKQSTSLLEAADAVRASEAKLAVARENASEMVLLLLFEFQQRHFFFF
jgi:hypothetical protein